MNSIGIEKGKATRLASKLNNLLADYMMFYQNSRGLHWNIKGEKFFELHLKYEELYTDLLIKADEIAERILTLGATPLHTFEDYKNVAKINSVKNISNEKQGVQSILNAFEIILTNQRELISISVDAEDEGTTAMMSDFIREQEKSVWMYSSFLNQ